MTIPFLVSPFKNNIIYIITLVSTKLSSPFSLTIFSFSFSSLCCCFIAYQSFFFLFFVYLLPSRLTLFICLSLSFIYLHIYLFLLFSLHLHQYTHFSLLSFSDGFSFLISSSETLLVWSLCITYFYSIL